ncbi:MAG: hypothetical protein ACI9OJ_001597 [Myxococcota bacterium]|jgi:hypothetical protein
MSQRFPNSSRFRFASPSARLVRVVVLALLLTGGCKKDAESAEEALPPSATGARVEPVPRSLKALCQSLAVRLKRKPRDEARDPTPVPMPPLASNAGVGPAERRLLAAGALDALSERLRRDPKNPEIHLDIGRIYLNTLENPPRAAASLCRAMLLRPKEPRFQFELLAAWMSPGQETRLELAIKRGYRTLPWRKTLDQARGLKGLDAPGRAAAFIDALRAQSIIRYNRTLPRRRLKRQIDDLPEFVVRWLAEGQGAPSIVVSVGQKYRSKIRHLLDRNDRETPPDVWTIAGPGPRWLVFGRKLPAVASTLAEASRRLRKVTIGVSVRQGDRNLYLVGRLDGVGFEMRQVAHRPDSAVVSQLLMPPMVEADAAP